MQENEKVVFTSVFPLVGNDKGTLIGMDVKLSITNKRLIFNNGAVLWTFNIFEDFKDFNKVNYGKYIFKGYYYAIALNDEMIYDNGKQKTSGLQFYFNKKTIQLEEKFVYIMNNLFVN